MTTFDELILSAQVGLEQAVKRREKALATVKMTYARIQQEGRDQPTDDETAEVRTQMENHKRSEADIIGAKGKLVDLQAAKDAEERADAMMAETRVDPRTTPPARRSDHVVQVGREERTYHPGNCRKGAEFLRDVLAARYGNDVEAQARLTSHMREERIERPQYLERAVGTGAFAGLTVPQYLTEMYAPAVAARRPFADVMVPLDLPEQGMTVNISRITTGSSVALQANENDPVSETNIDDTLLTIPVQTAAGRQTISRQGIDRGTGIEQVTMLDLQRRYATNLDSTVVTQPTTGLAAVSTVVAYTDPTPTGAELYPKLLAAMAGSEAALLGEATPDVAVMHSRRWYWLQKEMTATWPLFGQPGIAAQQGGVNFAEKYGSGFRGLLPNGTVAIVDNNSPTNVGAGTNEDEIYIAPSEESYLWEDPNAPQFIRSEDTKAENLGVVLVLYGYFAYTMQRYANSHQKVQGTGLVPPVF